MFIKKFLSIIFVLLLSLFCCSCFLNLDNQDGSSSTPPPQANNVDFSNLTYIAYGDSITCGADYTRGYAAMDDPYPELVSNILGLKSHSNLAISGSTLCSNNLNLVCMTDRIVANTTTANIVSVLMGVNDFNRSLPLGNIEDTTNSTVYGSLYLIAEHFKAHYSNSFVFFMTPFKQFYGGKGSYTLNSQNYTLFDVATAIKEVANKYNFPVLDLFEYGQYELEMYNANSDGLHPSQDFFRTYTAPQIAQFIKDNYNK